jgi:hypothetical protein
MTKSELLKIMADFNACSNAIKWAKDQPDEAAENIWNKCGRPDWMLWLAGRADIDRKVLVTAVCQVARTALKYVPEGEDRPLKAIEAAEGWVEGKVSIKDVEVAADAVSTLYAACAADYMANETANITSAAYRAVNTVRAAARAAMLVTETCAGAGAWLVVTDSSASASEIVEIVKKYISWEMVEKGLTKI